MSPSAILIDISDNIKYKKQGFAYQAISSLLQANSEMNVQYDRVEVGAVLKRAPPTSWRYRIELSGHVIRLSHDSFCELDGFRGTELNVERWSSTIGQ